MLSAMSGWEHATRWLLENKADVNAVIETNKNSALSLATAHGRSASVVQLLVDHGAALEHRTKACPLSFDFDVLSFVERI